jgi:hypothetical protein
MKKVRMENGRKEQKERREIKGDRKGGGRKD